MGSGVAHNNQMAFVGQTPWHGMGVEITDEAEMYDHEKFLIKANCNYEVEEEDVFNAQGEQIEGYKLTCGIVNGKRENFGIVGSRYEPLQNKKAFEWFQVWLDSKVARMETGGYLFNGSKIWALAKIDIQPQEVAKNDVVERFLMLSNSHDGTNAVRVGFTDIRIVCANTLAMAHNSKKSSLIRLRHSTQVVQNLENIREILDLANQEFAATAEQYRFLASRHFNANDLSKYIRIIMDVKEDEPTSKRKQNLCENLMNLVFSGKGNSNPAVAGSWFAAYNGVNQMLNYEYGNSQESRLNSLWFGGESARNNQRALELALEFANGQAA